MEPVKTKYNQRQGADKASVSIKAAGGWRKTEPVDHLKQRRVAGGR